MQLVKDLSLAQSASGGTSLITYYIPSGYSLWLVTSKLNKELGTATNIKDKTVRKDTVGAIKFGLYQLKSYGKANAPENGLVLLSGSIKSYV